MRRKLIALLVLAALLLSSFAPDAALADALPAAADSPVTGAEYAAMLDSLVERVAPEKLAEWQSRIPLFRVHAQPITRSDAVVALYYAAETIGGEYARLGGRWISLNEQIGEPWDAYQPTWDFFEGLDEISPFEGAVDNGFTRHATAYFYALDCASLVTGETAFAYNPATNSLDLPEHLTLQAAESSIQVAYESQLENLLASAEQAKAPTVDFEKLVNAEDTPTAAADSLVTGAEYAAMLDSLVERVAPEKLAEWQSRIPLLRVRAQPITRSDAVMALYYAAETIGGEYARLSGRWVSLSEQIGEPWDTYQPTRDFFEGLDEISPFEGAVDNGFTRHVTAYFYALDCASVLTGETPFAYNPATNSLDLPEPLTLQAAKSSIQVAYESQLLNLLVSAEQAKTSTVDFEKLANAEDMPEVSAQSIPRWRGTTINSGNVVNQYGRDYFVEQDIADIADMGFNYLRLMMFWFDFSAVKGDELVFNLRWLENLDRIVEYCAQHRIHLNMDMHVLPGYSSLFESTLFEDERSRAHSLLVWDVLSARYADVPANLLSYNLVNEPDANYFTSENYAVFAMEMIETIRQNDHTQKLLVSDGMLDDNSETSWGWRQAVPSRPVELLPADVMQAIHLYPCHNFTSACYVSLLDWPYEHAGAVNNNIMDNQVLRITGDFPAGTVVRLYVNGVYLGDPEDIQCMADGEIVATYPRSFTIGEDNCTEITDWAGFDTRRNTGYVMEFEIPQACGEIGVGDNLSISDILIKLPAEEERDYPVPHGGKMNGFVYERGAYDTIYIRMSDAWEKTASTIHIGADGFYTVENPAQCDMFDMETLRAYIARWAQWSKDTGTPIMCNEFGISVSLPVEARVAYMRSVLDLFEEYGIVWCLCSEGYECYSPVVSEKSVQEGHTILPADGSLTYRDGFWVDEPMLALLAEYMD